MAANLIIPQKDNAAEGYEQPLDVVNDGLAAAGFYPQVSSTLDQTVGFERVGNEARLKSGAAGSVSLSSLVQTVVSGNRVRDTVFENGLKTTVSIWRTTARTAADRIYDLAISRTDGLVSSTVEREYDASGALSRIITTTHGRTAGRVTLETVVVS